ncbi:MAG: alpha/beta fold hydrolase [Acidobacteria bacterium]|nr:alpha/beta fold hydrolase [Acidobacteriota bacterium]
MATLKAQGLISPFAQLYMPVYDVDFAYGERDRVKVNDTVTEGEYLSGENDEWTYWSTAVPIEALRFPAVTGNLSEPVVPVLNKIEIEVDTTGEGWCTDVDWFLLSFDVASPVVMAHGLGDSPNAFASSYETYLRDTCGLPVHNVDFRVNGVANSTIATNSEKLAAEIASVRAHLGVEQVSLLTHSMGGIVARHYTESHDDVDHVIQCGTPNVGSPVADFTWKLLLALYSVEDYTINFHDKYPEIQKFEGPGLLQMTTNYMGYVYNYAHGRKAKVKFSAIAGEQPHPSNDCPTTDVIKGSRAGSVIISGATLDVNDCVVTRMSAHGIPDPLWVGAAGFRVDNTAWVFDSSCNLHATHEYLVALAPVPPPLDEEQRHPVTYPIVLDWLRPPVFPERPAAREQASSVARSPRPKSTAFNATDGNVPNGAQSTAGDGAELLVGGVAAFAVPVSQSGPVSFVVAYGSGDVDVELRSPNGDLISTTGSGVTYAKGPIPIVNQPIVYYGLANAQSGVWTVTVRALASTRPDGVVGVYSYGTVGAVSQPVSIRLGTSVQPSTVRPGEPITLKAHLLNGEAPLVGAVGVAAKVQMLSPGFGANVAVPLFDDGTNGDEIALDGTYTGITSSTGISGTYALVWSVKGNLADSSPFSLGATGQFVVTNRMVGVGAANISESRRDLNANGLYDTLDINVPLTVETSGEYRIFGRLSDSNGNELTTASSAVLEVGQTTQSLSFSGIDLFANGADGPYAIHDIAVEALAVSGEAVLVTLLEGNQYSTQGYDVAEFEHDLSISETGEFAARGLDTDGSGKFDLLEVDVGVRVTLPGDYVVTAVLNDQGGAFVDSVTEVHTLVPGEQVARLHFDGGEIAVHQVDGPLVVRGFGLYGPDLPNFASTARYQTQPFYVEDFDCPYLGPQYVNGPASVTVAAAPGESTAIVNYTIPTFRYCLPFTVSCSPPSGSEFPVGSAVVTCVADAEDGTSSSFPIDVTVFEHCVNFTVAEPVDPLLPSASVGVPYQGMLFGATGGVLPVGFTATGLPPGMVFGGGGLTGVPTQSGGYVIAVTAEDAAGCTTTRQFGLNVSCPELSIEPDLCPPASTGVAYSATFAASGGTVPYEYVLEVYQGALPPGLTFAGGTLAGTPTAEGQWLFSVRATDANGCIAIRGYTLTISCPPLSIGPDSIPVGTVGVPYSATAFVPSGTAPFAFILYGTVPAGLALVDGTLVGTPTQAGTFHPTVHVTDSNGCAGSKTYALNVNSAPTARCRNVTVAAGQGCMANANVDNGSSDPDGGSVSITQTPGGPYPLGVTSVVLTVTDSQGATSQCNATVTVLDTILPVFPVSPPGVDVRATPGSTAAAVSFPTPIATDACGAVVVSCVPASGSEFPLGQTTVTCTAIDVGGNTSSATFTVYVRNSGDCLGSGSNVGQWYEASTNAAGAQVTTFSFTPSSPSGSYLDSVAGDWNGDGVDSGGVVFASSGAGGVTLANVYLRNSNSSGGGDLQFTVTLPANAGAPYVPLSGDWDGDGVSTLAFYRPATGGFYIRNTNSSGSPDFSFVFGSANSTPLRGDWDGNGTDTVGVYAASTFTFLGRNTNSAGTADLTLAFGVAAATSAPVTGDWDGDGVDSLGFIGSIAGLSGNVHLHGANVVAPPVLNFYIYLGSGRVVSGNWDGNHLPYVRSVSPQTCVAGQSNVLFTFAGSDLGAVSSVAFLPSDGITIGSVTGGFGAVTAVVTIDANAPTGLRSVRLESSGGHSNAVPIVVRAPGGIGETDTVGLVDVPSGSWLLRNSNSPGPASTTFYFSPYGPSLTPLRGDWNGDGIDTPGWFNPATNSFFLRNSNSAGPPDLSITFNVTTLSRLPVTGDWNGDGTDTVGLFETATGKFYLRNTNSPSSTQTSFVFRPVIGSVVPVIGDWDGSGTDTIGVYYATSGTFYLRNANSAGAANVQAQYGPSGTAFRPIVGDWNGDLTVTLGLYDPSTGAFFLKNSNSGGAADLVFTYGAASANYVPLVGDWDALGLP